MKHKKIIMILMLNSALLLGESYTVKKGDTLYSLAKKYKTSVEDLRSINNIKGTKIRIGQKLELKENIIEKIHIVKKGDTLYNIGKRNSVSVSRIKELNKLTGNRIYLGQRLLLPPEATETKTKSLRRTEYPLNFKWPIAWKGVTSPWGYRTDPITGKKVLKHTGIDLRASMRTPVYAPEGGKVRLAGWINGYGNTVIIDHGYGYSTLFGHLDSINVKNGQKIKKGTLIAKSGNTGRSTGPHLHYEIRYNNKPINPMEFRK